MALSSHRWRACIQAAKYAVCNPEKANLIFDNQRWIAFPTPDARSLTLNGFRINLSPSSKIPLSSNIGAPFVSRNTNDPFLFGFFQPAKGISPTSNNFMNDGNAPDLFRRQ
jgi:hypothetical protein